MRKFAGWIALAAGAAAGGVWACGSSVTACNDTDRGCADLADGSADSPGVQATLPDASDEMASDRGKGATESGSADSSTPNDSTTNGSTDDDADSAPPCTPTPAAPPAQSACIADGSGVFVATPVDGGSDTTGAGTVAKPYATISHALTKLGTSTAVYVCTGRYVDQITVSPKVSIYGGLSCAGGTWTYVASAVPVVTGSAPNFALQIASAAGAVDVEDMEFDGANGGVGQSSIAVWANASTAVALHRVKVVGGTGGVGVSGGTPTPNYTGATAPAGTTSAMSGAPGTITCVNGTMSQGGYGFGSSEGSTMVGSPEYETPYPVTSDGAIGRPGSDGEGGGLGGMALTSTGEWSLSGSVWIPAIAGAGTQGGTGQGGGGGDAGGISCNGSGGGAGGCGGAAGLGGANGGASFGLLSINSKVTLDACEITAGKGGNGGKGGDGEPGQVPGAGGSGAVPSCAGGSGGYGQGGGGGAGGAAGASAAIAYSDGEPTYGADTQIAAAGSAAAPGAGGTGGLGDPDISAIDPNLSANGATGAATVPEATMVLTTTL
jgi:hypothetical protein